MIFVNNLPKKTASIPRKKLIPVYAAKRNISLLCKRIKASLERDEKVVKPPQKPMVRNKRHSGDSIFPFSEIP
jgi:hypothetical protein